MGPQHAQCPLVFYLHIRKHSCLRLAFAKLCCAKSLMFCNHACTTSKLPFKFLNIPQKLLTLNTPPRVDILDVVGSLWRHAKLVPSSLVGIDENKVGSWKGASSMAIAAGIAEKQVGSSKGASPMAIPTPVSIGEKQVGSSKGASSMAIPTPVSIAEKQVGSSKGVSSMAIATAVSIAEKQVGSSTSMATSSGSKDASSLAIQSSQRFLVQ